MYVFYSKNPNFFTSARPIFQDKTDANQTINWLQPQCGNAGNQGGKARNQGANVGNQSENVGNHSENAGI